MSAGSISPRASPWPAHGHLLLTLNVVIPWAERYLGILISSLRRTLVRLDQDSPKALILP